MRYLTIALLAGVLAGCLHHPLGMSDAQWNALSVAEQQAARLEQETRNKERDRMQADEERRFDDAYGIDIN